MSNAINRPGVEPETNLRDFMRYEAVADRLFPLHNWRTLGADGTELGKTPLRKGWRDARHSFEEMRAHLEAGFNVGMRLGSGICVLDWDSRNDPTRGDPAGNSIVRLAKDTGFELRDDAIVETGNGLHAYAAMPADIGRRLNEIKRYPGLEYKADGRYVVCAGSRHPSGKLYRWRAWPC